MRAVHSDGVSGRHPRCRERALDKTEGGTHPVLMRRRRPLMRDAIHEACGFHLADAWIHPADLVAIGVASREEAAVK